MKDLPTELPEQFELAATPPRVDPRDVLVSKDYSSFRELPAGALVGTSSLRRRAQLKFIRQDLEYVEFRGNVDTRLRKLGEGQVAAIMLAAAGLDRLEKTEWVRERIEPEIVCPSAGQGSLGIESRKGDRRILDAVAFLDDPATRFAVTAERIALAALGGGCQVPIGIHCRPVTGNAAGSFEILGVVAAPDGDRVLRSQAFGNDAEVLGRLIAADLLNKGASELFEGIGKS